MAFDAFMKFTTSGTSASLDIEGETKDATATGCLEISEFSFGVENTLNITSKSGGAGAGKAEFKEFNVTKQTDSASPKLVLCCCLGGHYETVDLYLRKTGTTGTFTNLEEDSYLAYQFKMVAVKSIEWAGSSGDDVPTENVVFEYGSIKMMYKPQDDVGNLLAPIPAMWSVVKNAQTQDVR
ncbi:Hypothetical protein PBC10988_36600 [Planctomycetales bacterium 10988]|nr:Hypothetical protein PBC10988_36600 [Planctomycetales bacterium 10988]